MLENEITATGKKPVRISIVILAGILSFPASAMLVMFNYRQARYLYCRNFLESKSSLTTFWCHFISQDFRPDLVLIFVLVMIIHPIVFTIRNRKSNLRKLARSFMICLVIALVGILGLESYRIMRVDNGILERALEAGQH